MQSKVSWQFGVNDPSNANALAQIKQWWAGLNEQEVVWQQRMLGATQDLGQLDWSSQRFDERFYIRKPEMRGITLYWQKSNDAEERNTTPQKLELDTLTQKLLIFPQSQPGLVIQVGTVQVSYQTIKLNDPEITHSIAQGKLILNLRDSDQKLEVQATLSAEVLLSLKRQLP